MSDAATDQPLDPFWAACGAAGPLRLEVTDRDGRTDTRSFDAPFVVVGRSPGSDLLLDDPDVSRRHAYLQVIGGRVFGIDLFSRAGLKFAGNPRPSGWLDPDTPVAVGPCTLRVLGPTAPPGPDPDPVAARQPGGDPYPEVNLEIFRGGRRTVGWWMDRVLALVGKSEGCKVRLPAPGVSAVHCGLVRTAAGLWAIDLHSSTGMLLNGNPVRWTRLAEGDELGVGGMRLRVRYHQPAAAPPSAPTVVETAPASPPGEDLRERVAQLEQALADADRAAGEAADRWAAERRRLEAEWEADRRDRDAERDLLNEQADVLRAELAAAREGADTRDRGRRDELTAARDAAARERQQLQGDLDAARRDAAALRSELDAARQQAAAAEAASQQKLTAARESAARDRQQLQEKAEAARESAARERKQLHDEAEAARRDAAGLRAELNQARERGTAGEAALRKELAAARAETARERQRLQAEVESLRQGGDARSAQLAAERDRLRARVAELEQALAAAEEAREEVAGRLDAERKARAADRVRAEEERRRHNEELARAAADLDEAGAERDRLRDRADGLAAALDTAREEADDLRRGRDELQTRLDAREREREAWLGSVQPSQDYAAAAERFRAAIDRYARVVEQLDAVQADLRERAARGGKRRGAFGRLLGDSAGAGEESDGVLDRRLASLRADATAAQEVTKLAAAEAARADLEQQLADARRHLRALLDREAADGVGGPDPDDG